jgi:hypothetical protein
MMLIFLRGRPTRKMKDQIKPAVEKPLGDIEVLKFEFFVGLETLDVSLASGREVIYASNLRTTR